MRTASPQESLSIFMECFQEDINFIVDIGVQTGTSFLMNQYKNNEFHFLFEPVLLYHKTICDNYKQAGIDFELISAACSDTPGVMYQHLLSQDLSGRVTHSQLLPQQEKQLFGDKLLSILETPVITLDEWANDRNIAGNIIVKIDVDGIEDKIISGGSHFMSKAVLLIVESSLSALPYRASRIASLGFRLFDIVGNGYYFDQLQQVDLVFVADRVVSNNINLQPWKKYGKVIWDKWQQVS